MWHTWQDALRDPDLWHDLDQVKEVIHVDGPWHPLTQSSKEFEKTIIIPLRVTEIRNCPKDFASLVPSIGNLDLFDNKGNFYEFMIQSNLEKYIPRLIEYQDISFPILIKRLDLSSGIGIQYVENWDTLNEWINHDIFANKQFILQEYIEGDVEYVTHIVCRDGVILWSVTLQGTVPMEKKVNSGAFAQEISKLEPEHLSIFGQIFKLANYSGPACINFKISNGNPLVFEVNPRFGGSLFIPKFREQLVESLRTILENAVTVNEETDNWE